MEENMPHVVTQPCVKCKHTGCVTVCPVDSFREDTQMLVIDPEVCIDCGACVPECPVQAIFAGEEVPEKWKIFIQQNAERAPKLPIINEPRT
jgi:ferredoxin